MFAESVDGYPLLCLQTSVENDPVKAHKSAKILFFVDVLKMAGPRFAAMST